MRNYAGEQSRRAIILAAANTSSRDKDFRGMVMYTESGDASPFSLIPNS